MDAARAQSVTLRVVETLGRSIVGQDDDLAQASYSDADLTRRFGASRSVTREAVKMLVAKGLLETRPRRSASVQPEGAWNLYDRDVLRWLLERRFSLKRLRELTEIRLAVEPRGAAMAARHADEAARQAIQAALERMCAAERGHGDLLEADIAFHVSVLKATGNPFYAQFDGVLETALRISIRFSNAHRHARDQAVERHSRLADAILARDPEGAAQAMTDLLSAVITLIEATEASARS